MPLVLHLPRDIHGHHQCPFRTVLMVRWLYRAVS